MVTVQLKIVEEGLKHPLNQLKTAISSNLYEDNIIVKDDANLELKIKFTQEDHQDLVLLQLRDAHTKHKINEKVIHYIEHSWIDDISSEAHALLAPAAVTQ
jgi:hypothetical protein